MIPKTEYYNVKRSRAAPFFVLYRGLFFRNCSCVGISRFYAADKLAAFGGGVHKTVYQLAAVIRKAFERRPGKVGIIASREVCAVAAQNRRHGLSFAKIECGGGYFYDTVTDRIVNIKCYLLRRTLALKNSKVADAYLHINILLA